MMGLKAARRREAVTVTWDAQRSGFQASFAHISLLIASHLPRHVGGLRALLQIQQSRSVRRPLMRPSDGSYGMQCTHEAS